jgi:hypothetical protein
MNVNNDLKVYFHHKEVRLMLRKVKKKLKETIKNLLKKKQLVSSILSIYSLNLT